MGASRVEVLEAELKMAKATEAFVAKKVAGLTDDEQTELDGLLAQKAAGDFDADPFSDERIRIKVLRSKGSTVTNKDRAKLRALTADFRAKHRQPPEAGAQPATISVGVNSHG